ncbi:hypothetical protein TNCV_618111 [Trichonephila clavipes]|nr:hypothetical protein TNCV_618111 [Trichonephila clavipes]
MKIGEKLYSTIMETLTENIIVIEDDLILFEEGLFEEVEDSGLQSDDDEKRSKIDTDDIPLDYKIKVVNFAKEHPKWSLKNLQKKGGSRLKRMDQLKIREEQIRRGGSTKINMQQLINGLVIALWKLVNPTSKSRRGTCSNGL